MKILISSILLLVLAGCAVPADTKESSEDVSVVSRELIAQVDKKESKEDVSVGLDKLIVQADKKEFINNVSNGLDDYIVVTEPLDGDNVSCPLHVSGEARGYWYFEAIFPFELVGESGNLIASGNANAIGDWMTEEFVPFEFDIFYSTTEESGTLILKRSNASGLPENDMQLEIPVQLGTCIKKAPPKIEIY